MEYKDIKSAIENKLYNYKAMLKRATPNSEDFYCCRARVAAYEELLITIKQTLANSAKSSKDLQEHIDECWQTWVSSDNNPIANGDLTKEEFGFYARHFAQWQREQMMKNAIEGPFIRRNRYTKKNVLNGLDLTCDELQGFKDGQKLKVIFVPVDN